MTETAFWNYLKERLPGHLIRVENCVEPGTPDVNGCINGREFWIELKVDSNTISPEQKVWHIRRVREGGRVFVLQLTKGNVTIKKVCLHEQEVALLTLGSFSYPLSLDDIRYLKKALTSNL